MTTTLSADQTFEISDINGKNKRRVTLAEYRAELNARHALASPIMAALRRGDIEACGKAQAAMFEAVR